MRNTRSSFPKGSFLSRLFIVGEQTTFLKHMVNGARAWLQPRNPFESAIVDCLVAALWRHQRSNPFPASFHKTKPPSPPPPSLNTTTNTSPAHTPTPSSPRSSAPYPTRLNSSHQI